jgi:hypothetical protein
MSIKVDVIDLWKQGITTKEIVERTGYTIRQINGIYSSNKLPANRFSIIKEDENLRQFLIGSLLGDGSIPRLTGWAKTYNFSVAHKLEHLEYLTFKHTLLNRYALAPPKIAINKIYDERFEKGYFEECRFKSLCHPYFKNWRDLFYPNNVKIVPEIVKELNPFGLALLFMDDGNVTTYSYQISSCGFAEKDVDFLREILKNNFNINTTRTKDSTIHILAESKDTFRNTIKPYIIPIMEYKLYPYSERIVLNKSDKLLENPEEDNQQPS